ncbi:MAG TPA: hypothetical protein VK108_05400 [Pseudogracilibacillus sp.]|nr:hypothetical protein [Pseudogracilibacillus sp.]
MKQSLRFFSLGILVSAILLLGYTLFFSGDLKQADPSVEEMSDSLSDQGYRVVSEDEYVKYTLDKDKASNSEENDETNKEDEDEKEKDESDNNDDNDDKKDKDKKKEKATIKTESGVVAPDIAEDLVEEKIIKKDEKDDFAAYMDDEGYSEKVQLGKFKVDSDMDFKELAKTFTTYSGD